MRVVPLSSVSNLPYEGQRRLESYLGTVVRGQPKNLVTPYLPDEYRSDERKFAQWAFDNIARSGIPELDEIERHEVEKFGPFSIRDPYEMRRDSVTEYFGARGKIGPELRAIVNEHYDKVKRWIPKHSLHALAMSDSYSAMPKDSNLGLPWFTRSKDKVGDYLKRAITISSHGWKTDIYPAVLGWRGQPNGDMHHIKNRVVWMQDHLETIVGLSVQIVVLDKLKGRPEFAAWNELGRVDSVVTSLLDRTSGASLLSSNDFSGFDKSLPGELIDLVFELLLYWFHDSNKGQILWLKRQLLQVGLVTPDGVMYDRFGGMPSGSALTNLIDTLVSILLFGMGTTSLGDDSLAIVPSENWITGYSELLTQDAGMTLSADKGLLSKDVAHYLQRLHLRQYRKNGLSVGVRSIVRTLNGMCHLERHTPNLQPQYFTARAIMQAENSHWHPKFKLLVKYLYENDRYLREGVDPVKIFRLAGGVKFVERTMKLEAFRFGVELPSAGLDKFETVKLIRTLQSKRPSQTAA